MKYYQTFTVKGANHFPLDMLRYDHCWPKYEVEIGLILDEGTRMITIARDVVGRRDTPTVDRWRSFGWEVSSVHTEKS